MKGVKSPQKKKVFFPGVFGEFGQVQQVFNKCMP